MVNRFYINCRMLDSFSPNEECIVEDIDDWCVQQLQCVSAKGGRKPYYCQHVRVHCGGWHSFG